MSDVYILLKDLPDSKIGTRFKRADLYFYIKEDYFVREGNHPAYTSTFPVSLVEACPEWFEKETSKEVWDAAKILVENGYEVSKPWKGGRQSFFSSKHSYQQVIKNLKKEPESVEEKAYSKQTRKETNLRNLDFNKAAEDFENKWSESIDLSLFTIQDMEECFEQSRDTDILSGKYIHESFQSYMNIKK